ncbi:hypothetical protein Poli38472_007121 [Pythium oligandrum]|uniref:RING-type domain-containing protein n=1 Tax=Pythium oligandrum TaxID=41045 RepID=A0A8K1C9Q8_PYTOL|nr:hypothetical protein Poli38472_007121 [Pythium oligandrum]|eukprot:TMW58976.1 hypothetical protein Poli38472_007121 [Pythium oligandrum]
MAKESEVSAVAALEALSAAPVPIEEPESEPETCQICLEEKDPSVIVTKFCNPKCPAVVCSACVSEHIRVTVDSAFNGVLPKIHCPICLVPMNKSRWEAHASHEVLAKYKDMCGRTCSFQTPCCHNAKYTHLPVAIGTKSTFKEPEPLKLVPSLKAKFPQLRALTKRFCNHKLNTSSLVRFIEEEFGAKTSLDTQHLLMEHLYRRILDDERRATLLITYHTKYKLIKTRCCARRLCFNCKRTVRSKQRHDFCESEKLADSSIVQCRWCRVMIVKSEGCNSVHCWCGTYLNWFSETDIRDKRRRGLIPVDIFDIDHYDAWNRWRQRLYQVHLVSHCHTRRLKKLTQLILPFKPRLLRVLQRYCARRRWNKVTAAFKKHEHTHRLTRIETHLRQTVMLNRLLRWRWHLRWQKVVGALHDRNFWSLYYEDRVEELEEIQADERAILQLV